MKATDHFKTVIQVYLDQRAQYDELFATAYRNPNKSLEDCVTYILSEVQRSGCNGFADDEIFSMAMHYYDEPNIEIGNPIACNVVINHHIELTEEEKQQARKEAIKRIENEAYANLKQTNKPSKPAETQAQALLFDF